MSRLRHDLDEEVDEDLDELAYRFRFRNPNDRKRNRVANNDHSPKAKHYRHRYDETEYDES
ncbi:MAG: hypothetical protein P8Z39_08465 [Gammaproteobacteria bacterium]